MKIDENFNGIGRNLTLDNNLLGKQFESKEMNPQIKIKFSNNQSLPLLSPLIPPSLVPPFANSRQIICECSSRRVYFLKCILEIVL